MISKRDWSQLTSQQLGKYAEYLSKMEFTSYGLDVYSAEVDDKGIDFIVRSNANNYYDIQVKSIRGSNYVFMQKSKFVLRHNLYLVLVLFPKEGSESPIILLIPSLEWQNPELISLFVGRDYVGKKSLPEWGVNITKRNLDLLARFQFSNMIEVIKQKAD